jgi:hypothetical protein
MDALLADGRMQYLILGEYHGTQEMPRAAGEIACDLAQRGLRVALALELPATQSNALTAYVDGRLEAPDLLAVGKFWTMNPSDGRNTDAMLALLTRVRQLRQAGLGISVSAVDWSAKDVATAQDFRTKFALPPEVDAKRSIRDILMADRLISLSNSRSYDVVVFLVGSSHAELFPRRKPFFSPDTGKVTRHFVTSAAALLPREGTMSLKFTHSGGMAYAFRGAVGASEAKVPADPGDHTQPAIMIGPPASEAFPYDGTVSVGPVTASLPVLAKPAN